ncbi:MAG: nucleotidyl transferase AbiEii/AbiGii toxin family protein [Fidelibacterota bacterium]
MNIFHKHEQFEMEVLELLNSSRVLPSLIFGGGTMLRLCHGLDRYSADLDFFLYKPGEMSGLFDKIIENLSKKFTLTDQADKHRTFLVEIQSNHYPRKLKIEINKTRYIENMKKEIAWSPFSTIQVMVNAIALPLMAEMKAEALLDRKEIRDAYDLEFLARKAVALPDDEKVLKEILDIIQHFRKTDYTSKLGSVLEKEKRQYHIENRFRFLEQTIYNMLKK